MDQNNKLLETYEVLTELREKAQAMRRLKDESSTLQRDVHNLVSSISTGLKDINTSGRQICNETNDIKYQFESDNSLRIGRESVRPLIDLKNIATEIFANVKENGTNNDFTEDIDFGLAYQELEEMRESANKSKEFIKRLNSAAEGIAYLVNERDKTIRSESTLSITGSDPSMSGFSWFENSEMNVATSSPISHF